MIEITKGPRKLGVIVVASDGIQEFQTWRNYTHFFFKYHGFGIAEKTLYILQKNNIERIRLIYTNNVGKKTEYITNVSTFFRKGIKVHEDGWEEQYILPIFFFKEERGIKPL